MEFGKMESRKRTDAPNLQHQIDQFLSGTCKLDVPAIMTIIFAGLISV